MKNWDRQYSILVGIAGSSGFELGAETNGRALHVNFDIEKSDVKATNQAKLQIWNLNDEHKAFFKNKDCVVEIRAGYGDVIVPCFLGNVNEVAESIDDANRMVEIELTDGRDAYYAISNVSLSGVISAQTVVDQFVKDMTIPSSIVTQQATTLIGETKYDNGFSFVGKSKDGLSAALEKCGCTWSIQNGVVQIFVKGEAVNTQAYLLDVTTGLINIPKAVKLQVDGQDVSGYEIEYLMNCAIGVNDLVQVKSKELNGVYRVKEIAITGDNYDGDWLCTAKVVEVK